MLLYCSERTRTPIKALRASQRAYSTQNDKLHYKQKEPPQSLTEALWRFGFMNVLTSYGVIITKGRSLNCSIY